MRSISDRIHITSRLQALIRRNEQAETRLHGKQVSAVELTQRSIGIVDGGVGIVSVYHGVHHLRTFVIEDGRHHRCIRSGAHKVVHHINHTVVGKQHLLDTCLIGIDGGVRSTAEHGVLRIVHDGQVLAGHALVERLFHQVVDKELHDIKGYLRKVLFHVGHERLDDIQRNLIQVLQQVFLRIFKCAVTLNQDGTTTTHEVVLHGLVAGHKHSSHILFF